MMLGELGIRIAITMTRTY